MPNAAAERCGVDVIVWPKPRRWFAADSLFCVASLVVWTSISASNGWSQAVIQNQALTEFGTIISTASTELLTSGGQGFIGQSRAAAADIGSGYLYALPLDIQPPRTQLLIGSPQFGSNPVLVSSRTLFGFTAVDDLLMVGDGIGLGVAETGFTIDSGPLRLFSSSFQITTDGLHTISWFSQDVAGNVETTQSASVLVDATPPQATLLCPAAQGFCSVIKGSFPVIGSVSDLHLVSWRLESAVGQNASSGFSPISAGTATVSSNILGTWDTTALTGWQTLRLSALDLVANQTVVAQNVFVGDPSALLSIQGFERPSAVALGLSGLIYIADTNHDRIVVVTSTGGVSAIYGRKDRPRSLDLSKPRGVATDAFGNIYIADTGHNRILEILPSGQFVLSLGKNRKQGGNDDDGIDTRPGSGPGEFRGPTGLVLDAANNLYVADTGNHRIQKFSSGGIFLFSITLPSSPLWKGEQDEERDESQQGRPVGLALDQAGNIYTTDQAGNRVLKYDPLGNLLQTYAPGLKGPTGISVSTSADCIAVSDTGNNRILRLDRFGDVLLTTGGTGPGGPSARPDKEVGSGLSKNSIVKRPSGLALDLAGNLLVADRNNDQILKLGAPQDGGLTNLVALTKPVFTPTSASAWISQASGGAFFRPNGAGIIVPPGSLPQNMTITVADAIIRSDLEEAVKSRKQNAANLVAVSTGADFNPDGTQFKTPVTIVVPYDQNKILTAGLSELGLQVFFWNRDKQAWQWQASTVDTFHHTVSAQVFHFSTYQVMGRKPPAAPTAQPQSRPGAQ